MGPPHHHHLRRSFSSSNQIAASMITKYIIDQEEAFEEKRCYLHKHVTKSCMIIPSLHNLDKNGQKEALCSIVDTEILVKCEQSNVINWLEFSRLIMPMFVEENSIPSLFDSVSLFIWGISSGHGTLLKFVQHFAVGKDEDLCRQYFNHYNDDSSGNSKSMSVNSERSVDWNDIIVYLSNRSNSISEDDELLDGCSSYTKSNPVTISFIIFLLCNVIARPIIVLSELTDASVSGIYIPLIRKPDDCERSPVFILNHSGRFMPLFSCEDMSNPLSSKTITNDATHCLPLCFSNKQHFKLHFVESNLNQKDGCINLTCIPVVLRYMDISMMPIDGSSMTEIPVVFLTFNAPPSYSLQMQWSWLRSIHERLMNRKQHGISSDVVLCSRSTFGCENEGIASLKGLCLACYTTFVTVSSNVPKRKLSISKPPEASEKRIKDNNIEQKSMSLCINPNCNKPKIESLYDRCRSCYLDHILSEKSKLISSVKECCMIDCNSIVLPDMDLCANHLNQLQNQESVQSGNYNDNVDGCFQNQIPQSSLLQLPSNNISAQGRGEIDPSFQSYTPQSFYHSHSSPNLQSSRLHSLISENTKRHKSLPIENREMQRYESTSTDRPNPVGSESFVIESDAAPADKNEKHPEDYEILDSDGNSLGITTLKKCFLPECDQIVYDENEFVCTNCALVQKETLDKIESDKKEEKKPQPVPIHKKICEIPHCSRTVSDESSDFCLHCLNDQFSCSPDADPRCTTHTDLSSYNQQPSRSQLPPEFESILLNALSSPNPETSLTKTTGPCKTPHCDLYGTMKFQGYCSKCHNVKKYHR